MELLRVLLAITNMYFETREKHVNLSILAGVNTYVVEGRTTRGSMFGQLLGFVPEG